MKTQSLTLPTLLIFVAFFTGNVAGDLVELDSGDITALEQRPNNGDAIGPFLAGTSTFNVTAAEIPDVELLADFFLVDAGVRIEVNGTSLFPDFVDISNFGPEPVFTNTGEPNGGGVNFPFSTNNNGPNGTMLPRLTVNSTSAGTAFSGATFTTDNFTRPYTPVFTVADFNSLLVEGSNTIDFFVLNTFEQAELQGEFTVSLNTPAIPEPGMTGVAVLAIVTCLTNRRKRNVTYVCEDLPHLFVGPYDGFVLRAATSF